MSDKFRQLPDDVTAQYDPARNGRDGQPMLMPQAAVESDFAHTGNGVEDKPAEVAANGLVAAHGGRLKNLILPRHSAEWQEVREMAEGLPPVGLNERQLADFELMMIGAASPLEGPHNQRDYESVRDTMRLRDGTLWSLPFVFDVDEKTARMAEKTGKVTLRHPEGNLLGVLAVNDIYTPDLRKEAEAVLGTTDENHPSVYRLMHETNGIYLGGTITGLELPPHHVFKDLRKTPEEMREEFAARGWDHVVAFQTRNPMHRAHFELAGRAWETAAAEYGSDRTGLLIHPAVGPTQPGDVDMFIRTRAHERVVRHYPDGMATLGIVPIAMRMAGPREAVQHMIIRKNYGADGFVVGRDMAGPSQKHSETGRPFYNPYDAQNMALQHADELGMTVYPSQELVYVQERDKYVQRDEVQPGETVLSISGTEQRKMLREGIPLPDFFTFPDVEEVLKKDVTPKARMGMSVMLTGADDEAVARVGRAVAETFHNPAVEAATGRRVTVLDNDTVNARLAKGIDTDTPEGQSALAQRAGYVAGEIAKHGGLAVVAIRSPQHHDRKTARTQATDNGGAFLEVHVNGDQPLAADGTEQALYTNGSNGNYESPLNSEVTVDKTVAPGEASRAVLAHLVAEGYVKPDAAAALDGAAAEEVLEDMDVPNSKKGLSIFFTGLSGAGKSTIGNALARKMRELALENGEGRKVSILDGDIVRTHLTKGLGFSPEDRKENVTRVGWVASKIAHHGGAAISALVSPYRADRDEVRQMVEDEGGAFVEVHVATSLAECEKRDTKGLYRQAREGRVKGMTGIDAPYEEPLRPEITIRTEDMDVEASAQVVVDYLVGQGYIKLESQHN